MAKVSKVKEVFKIDKPAGCTADCSSCFECPRDDCNFEDSLNRHKKKPRPKPKQTDVDFFKFTIADIESQMLGMISLVGIEATKCAGYKRLEERRKYYMNRILELEESV